MLFDWNLSRRPIFEEVVNLDQLLCTGFNLNYGLEPHRCLLCEEPTARVSGMHFALQTAGVKPTQPGGRPRDTAVCLRRRLCSPRLAMALWPYPLVVVECT